MPSQLLGGLSPQQFLDEYWQKKPLLIRQAVTDFPELIDLHRLIELATRDDVESRLIEHRNGRWHMEHGPFRPTRFNKLPDSDWTVLVQNVNQHVDHIAELLYRFNFLPYTRLDDIMISYAPPGGSVGPHYDSYDVFLLQVGGRKRWQISSDDAGNFIEDAPIRVLKDFQPEQEWVLEHGDMLYLPPKYAHHGVALDPGMTYSVGFRAPKTQEIASRFLEFLQDNLQLDGMLSDPGRRVTDAPARIDTDFASHIAAMLQHIQWDEALVSRFIGEYFSEPKQHVVYDAPDEPLDFDEFAAAVAEHGVVLDLKSVLLFDEAHIYCNGEALECDPDSHPALQQLANARRLLPGDYDDTVLDTLYECYDYGYLHVAG
ncbi:50S ribosomal protein L16 3-hydroxylase [Andreprevotia lacus DSM 23236]|jgi:50S ribosomal protein L16 3-hydroxylase|uniref:50S ribosomal protein L16 3-hydroxylase n=1 Tax=Andreprevotia lacus DSM 23236 TaxID=1121001 RepID=A0A1W1XPA0_9NEIS|nr:cupin domain-containing protein [Andreprevotia lacus]SMC25694.1 50S ribosomal protein L16 3-hydroxylase [Andreprevotia lacus DSM 23236]